MILTLFSLLVFSYSKKKGITFLSFSKKISFLTLTEFLISFSYLYFLGSTLLPISLQEKKRREINNNLKKCISIILKRFY